MNGRDRLVAVILAAGRGKRMGSDLPKQYLMLNGKPVVCHSLDVMEHCSFVDDIVLVVGIGEREYIKEQIVEFYGYRKVTQIVEGGKERYHSVANALCSIDEHIPDAEYVLIHDGARPYLEEAMLNRLWDGVRESDACIAAVPVKDTVKIVDENGVIRSTPDRSTLWAAQTPQAFRFTVIRDAYRELFRSGQTNGITDDAQVLERMTGKACRIVEGSYRNIKITTPEDLPQ